MLTSKELMLIQDNIKMGQSMTNFLNACVQSSTDSQLKSLCQTMVSNHQRDLQTLANHIKNPNIQ